VFAVFGILAAGGGRGPTLGGFLVTNVGWRWIFFVTAGRAIVLAAAMVLVPDLRPGRRHRLDLAARDPWRPPRCSAVVFFGLIGRAYHWGTVGRPRDHPRDLAPARCC